MSERLYRPYGVRADGADDWKGKWVEDLHVAEMKANNWRSNSAIIEVGVDVQEINPERIPYHTKDVPSRPIPRSHRAGKSDLEQAMNLADDDYWRRYFEVVDIDSLPPELQEAARRGKAQLESMSEGS